MVHKTLEHCAERLADFSVVEETTRLCSNKAPRNLPGAELIEIYGEPEARKVLLTREFGDVPPGLQGKPWTVPFTASKGDAAKGEERVGPRPGLLMANGATWDDCHRMTGSEFQSLESQKSEFRKLKGEWAKAVDWVEQPKLDKAPLDEVQLALALESWARGYCVGVKEP